MRLSASLSLAVVALAAGPAFGDTVKLKNGDTLTGTVVSVVEGKLTLKTEAAGELTVDLAAVDSFATDAPVTLVLKNGDTVHGRAFLAQDGAITTETESMGSQTLALANVASVNPPPKPPRKWTGDITLAATWTTGNTETERAALDINAVNRGEVDRLSFEGWYRAGRETDQATGDSSTSERRLGARLKYDYFFAGTKAYGYGNASGEKDAIAALDLRFIAGVGGGYQFIETEKTKFNVEGGLSWFSENYSNGTPSADDIAARLYYKVEHEFHEMLLGYQETAAYKVFSDPQDYLVLARIGMREKLTGSFFAQQWIEFAWDSTPALGKERTDVTYFIGLGWTF